MNYPSAIASGTLVDRRYHVIKILGQGGFGRTYLVKDKKSFDNLRVLKEFVPQATDEYVVNKSRELFEREAKVLNQLEHEQIPEFFGWFEEHQKLFLVQQFVDGETYAQLLQKKQQANTTFSELEVTQLLIDLLPVLEYIHTNNIIHRDISPDNIMRCRQADKPILIDFGVVNQRTATQVASGAVRAGTTVGKQSYSPIEQIARGICFPNSDLYALAITAMVLLTGKQPDDFFDAHEERWQWREYAQVSDSLARVIDKMSAENHRDRYQSATEVLEALSDLPTVVKMQASESSVVVNPQTKTPLLAIGGVAVIALLGGLFLVSTPNIKSICNILNNCSADIKFAAEYEKIVTKSQPIIAAAASDNNLENYSWEQLQDLKLKLKKLASELEEIPQDTKVASQAQQTLAEVTAQLQRVNKATTIDVDNMFVNPKFNN